MARPGLCGAGVQTRGFLCAKQVLTPTSYIPSLLRVIPVATQKAIFPQLKLILRTGDEGNRRACEVICREGTAKERGGEGSWDPRDIIWTSASGRA